MSFKLKEFEGKNLLKQFGIKIPSSKLVTSINELNSINNAVVKSQILSGKRARNNGVKICNSNEEIKNYVNEILNKKILDETVKEVLVEEKIDIIEEHYIAFMFNTKEKCPQLIISKNGGVDIEEFHRENPEELLIKNINALTGLKEQEIIRELKKIGFKNNIKELAETILKLYKCFEENDLKLLEINPLACSSNNEYIALDCVAIIDSDALGRHNFNFPPRIGFREPTLREIEARKIDEHDYRGVAGKTFLDLDGDMAILASGGGASIVCMDALLTYNGKPANFTEYSGNPSKEKVKKLALLTLSKSNLNGLWIVGGTANFTDIEETFKGLIEAFKEINPKYPIVIRRAGPNDKKAFELIKKATKEYNWNIHLFDENTPMTVTAKTIVDLADEYKKNNHKK